MSAMNQPPEGVVFCIVHPVSMFHEGLEMGPGMRIDIFAAGACVEVVMIPSPRSSQLQTKTNSI